MRFNLRLSGRTASGQRCQADITVYASSQAQLREQANRAAETAAWRAADPPHDPIPEGAHISIEKVEKI